MLSRIFLNLLVLLLTPFSMAIPLAPVVHEVTSFRQIVPFIRPDSVVIFDLDNTLMEPVQTLGSDQFFSWLVQRGKQAGLPDEAAKDQALLQAGLVQPRSQVRPVERWTPTLIQWLQRSGHLVFALTARPSAWTAGTLGQIASLGVDFRPTTPRAPLGSEFGGELHDGVLFLKKGFEKGPTLVNFFDRLGLRPAQVLFIDDKPSNVQSVSQALAQRGITHHTFRYGATDGRVKSFDPQIAEREWTYFLKTGVFISDEQAAQQNQTKRSVGPSSVEKL